MKTTVNLGGSQHSADVLAVITDAIRAVSAKARDVAITTDSLLLEEVGLDSLDLVAVVLRLEDHYLVEIDPDEIATMRSVGDVVASLNKQLRAAA
jgi:acyl carrier protein